MTFHFMPGLWMQEWGLEITGAFASGPRACGNTGECTQTITCGGITFKVAP